MTEKIAQECQDRIEAMRVFWPFFDSVPIDIAAHARACSACGTALESLRELCRRSPSWQQTLPASRFARLAASTRGALRPRKAPRPLIWAPALALAAACLVLLRDRPPTVVPARKPASVIPAELVKNIDLLEQLDLVENLDMVEAMIPDKPAAPRNAQP